MSRQIEAPQAYNLDTEFGCKSLVAIDTSVYIKDLNLDLLFLPIMA
jgi:hypothetical protein